MSFIMGRVDLLIQNWFHRKSKGRQCKGRWPRNFDFLSWSSMPIVDIQDIDSAIWPLLTQPTPHSLQRRTTRPCSSGVSSCFSAWDMALQCGLASCKVPAVVSLSLVSVPVNLNVPASFHCLMINFSSIPVVFFVSFAIWMNSRPLPNQFRTSSRT